MLGSGFRFYLCYTNVTTPLTLDTLVKADGTIATAGATASINDIAASFKLADEIKNVTEAGNPNTINTTTRRTGRQGVQANEITTISRDLSAEFVYAPHTAFGVPTSGYEVLDLLEYCEETKSAICAIDVDQIITADGAKGAAANYTAALSQPREVEGQVQYDVTFAVQGFYQRVEWEVLGSLWKAKVDP